MVSDFRIVIRLAATVCGIVTPLTPLAAEKPAESRNVIYNPRSETPELDGIAAKLFSNQYRVIAIKSGSEFVRARLKGHNIYLPSETDPRPMRDQKTSAKASVGFVVGTDGVVRDLRVLESTDRRVADFLMKKIQERRFAPAQYRGAPVASLEHMKVDFGPTDERDYNSMYKDGMGIMGQRDR
jgi:outer membrane biosynthesis protein TonB